MVDYEASIILVHRDKNDVFEDVETLGVSHSAEETRSLMYDHIMSLMESYEESVTLSEERSLFDVPIVVASYSLGSVSYYCLFKEHADEASENSH